MQDARSQPAEPHWWTFERVALIALLFAAAVVLLQVSQQGREEARAAGDREATLREQVKGIDAGALLRHAELLRQLDDLERETVLLRLRIDSMNAILDSRGVPPPRQPASLKTPERQP